MGDVTTWGYRKDKNMEHDQWFDSDENKTLMAICVRRLIKNIGIGGIIWGVINLVFGYFAMRIRTINVGIVILGVMMLGTGVQALKQPSLGVLLMETIVSVCLFLWNVGMAIFNMMLGLRFEPRGIIVPLIIAVTLATYYHKLGHLRELIASVPPEKVDATKRICKTLLKKKLKNEPLVVQTSDGRCRAQLVEDRVFFIQRDLMRAFVGSRESIRSAIAKPDEKKWTAVFNHPLGKLKYKFDKKNTEKLRTWLATEQAPTPA
jgi:hypothetical protein